VLGNELRGEVEVKVAQTEEAFGGQGDVVRVINSHCLEGRTRPVPSWKTRLSHDIDQYFINEAYLNFVIGLTM